MIRRTLAWLLYLPVLRRLPWPFSRWRGLLFWHHPTTWPRMKEAITWLDPGPGPFSRLLADHRATRKEVVYELRADPEAFGKFLETSGAKPVKRPCPRWIEQELERDP